MSSLSLVVCTLHRPRSVQRLLEALAVQTVPADEVLVVDASDDEQTAAVVDEADGVPGLVHHAVGPAGRGLTKQRNVGIERSSGDLVAFLDDDTVPDPAYVAELHACFDRHPDAAGVGGTIDEGGWRRAVAPEVPSGWYRRGGWERREGARWRLRRLLGLDAGAPPGHVPRSGHGRPIAFLPPDGEDHEVELLMGGASAWRREVLERHRFDPGFEGYGLYEDLELCLRAREDGPLFVAGSAHLVHEHAPEGRPDHRRYGRMVVENGWYVWRRRWPEPSAADRVRWWATTVVLALCRAAGGRAGRAEATGRFTAMPGTLRCEWSARAVARRYAAHEHVDDVVQGVRRRSRA